MTINDKLLQYLVDVNYQERLISKELISREEDLIFDAATQISVFERLFDETEKLSGEFQKALELIISEKDRYEVWLWLM